MPPKKADKGKALSKVDKGDKAKARKLSSREKKSPDKKSPIKKGTKDNADKVDAIPIEQACQTITNTTCMLCAVKFSSHLTLQCHLSTHNHFVETAPIQLCCRVCKDYLYVQEYDNHYCYKNKNQYLHMLSGVLIEQGPPNVCLVCRGRPFNSRTHLITHLCCAHAPQKVALTCGLCPFTYEETEYIPTDEPFSIVNTLPTYNKAFDDHILQVHFPQFDLALQCVLHEESSYRYPYSCILCNNVSMTNAHLHAHVISCHATQSKTSTMIKTCLICNTPKIFMDDKKLQVHINNKHHPKYHKLGEKWIKNNHITNYVDMSRTCIICWKVCEYDFELQSHIVVNHFAQHLTWCGWCSIDLNLRGNEMVIWKELQRHEQLHVKEVHRKAILYKVTEISFHETLPPEELGDNKDDKQNIKRDKSPPGKKGKDSKADSPKFKKAETPLKAKKPGKEGKAGKK